MIAGRGRTVREKRAPLPIDLDLRLDLGERLTLRAFGFDGGVAGQLRVLTVRAHLWSSARPGTSPPAS